MQSELQCLQEISLAYLFSGLSEGGSALQRVRLVFRIRLMLLSNTVVYTTHMCPKYLAPGKSGHASRAHEFAKRPTTCAVFHRDAKGRRRCDRYSQRCDSQAWQPPRLLDPRQRQHSAHRDY